MWGRGSASFPGDELLISPKRDDRCVVPWLRVPSEPLLPIGVSLRSPPTTLLGLTTCPFDYGDINKPVPGVISSYTWSLGTQWPWLEEAQASQEERPHGERVMPSQPPAVELIPAETLGT